jgi:hypothetical protein
VLHASISRSTTTRPSTHQHQHATMTFRSEDRPCHAHTTDT